MGLVVVAVSDPGSFSQHFVFFSRVTLWLLDRYDYIYIYIERDM